MSKVLAMWSHEEREDLAKTIKPARERLGMFQYELAEAANVTRRTISSIEGGKVVPQSEVLERLLQALGLNPVRRVEIKQTGDLENLVVVLTKLLELVPTDERAETAAELVHFVTTRIPVDIDRRQLEDHFHRIAGEEPPDEGNRRHG